MYFIQPIEILFSIKPVESASSPILKGIKSILVPTFSRDSHFGP